MRIDERNKIIGIKQTLHWFSDIPLHAGVNCFGRLALHREVLGILQKYLRGVVGDSGCKHYTDAERTLTEFAWRTPTRSGCTSLSLIAAQPREYFFYMSRLGKKAS